MYRRGNVMRGIGVVIKAKVRRSVYIKRSVKRILLFFDVLRFIQFARIALTAVLVPIIRPFSQKVWLFSVNAHASVVEDLRQELAEHSDVRLIVWNLSGANAIFRTIFKRPDPVPYLERRGDLTPDLQEKFQKRFHRFLSSFDGFVVTYPISYLKLYTEVPKPVLAVAAVRYETPFSDTPELCAELNEVIWKFRNENRLTLVANNQGDADYASHFLGFNVPVVASVCDYIALEGEAKRKLRVVHAKNQALEEELARLMGAPWLSKKKALGKNYAWNRLSGIEAVAFFPYTNSVMSLFEYATLGIRVCVPSKELVKDLSSKFTGILENLSYLVHGKISQSVSLASMLPGADPSNPGFIDWWLDRADFYSYDLMPNVQVFETLEEANLEFPIDAGGTFRKVVIEKRNLKLAEKRSELIREFLTKVKSNRGADAKILATP